MDRIIDAFNRYYGWILAFGIIYGVLGGLSVAASLMTFDILGLVVNIFAYVIPAFLIIKFCSNIKQAKLTNNVENIEQACRYQSIFIIFMGVVALITLIFIVIALLGGAAFGLMGMGM